MNEEEKYMLRCIELAKKGIGKVSPNPMVGAVLVFDGRIIGEGWHQVYGQAHAEVNCLKSVALEDQKYLSQSCLYVSLEPCNHFGKTPPCCDLILQKSIKKVVIGCTDTNPAVSGSGIRRLKEKGVEVKVGVLELACRKLNKRFFTRQEKSRPYTFLKWAETADGFMGMENTETAQISDWPETRAIHKMRYEEDAILVGYKTAFKDNPKLSSRFWKSGKQPLRIVVDFQNSLPENFNLKDNRQKTIIFNFRKEETIGNTSWKKLTEDKPLVPQIMNSLKRVDSLIVEGGSKTLQTFIDSGFWDEIHLWKSTEKSFGKGIKAPVIKNAKCTKNLHLGKDELYFFEPELLS